METARLRVAPTGVLVVAITVFLLLVMAAPAPASFTPLTGSDAAPLAPPDGANQTGLTAIDVPAAVLPALQRLGITYQDEPHEGLLRAAATSEQLALLRAEGVAVSEIGGVSIFSRSDSASGEGSTTPTTATAATTATTRFPTTTGCTLPSGPIAPAPRRSRR